MSHKVKGQTSKAAVAGEQSVRTRTGREAELSEQNKQGKCWEMKRSILPRGCKFCKFCEENISLCCATAGLWGSRRKR